MNCPVCNQPMHTVDMSSSIVIEGWRVFYNYQRMYCDYHPQQTWQTPEQLQSNLDAINAAKAAAAKLKN